MKNPIKLVFILLMVVVLACSCTDSWFRAEITSSVDFYDPATSSLPGLPLEIKYDIDGPTPGVTAIIYITNKGSFVYIEDDQLINAGRTAQLSGKKIYWVPDEENGDLADSARIKAIISYFDKIVEVSKTFSARIIKDRNGAYVIR